MRRSSLVVAGLLAVVVYGLLMLLSRFRQPVGFAFYGLAWLFLVHLGLSALFARLEVRLAQRWPRPEQAARRVAVYSVLGLGLGVAFFDAFYVAIRLFEARILGVDGELSAGHLLTASGLGAILSAVTGAVVLARADLIRWRRAEERVLALRQEATVLELGALRRQLDPHFLFNSLNTLASLIPEDPETATAFVEELAEVYRHVLRSAERDLVTLGEELGSVRSLAFLFEKRFEEAFRFEAEVSEEALGQRVVPLALHTLLENAVQHNVATRERPLVVTVTSRDGVLEVANSRRSKPSRREGGVGLQNLRRSYDLLEAGPFEVEESEERFVVKIPLLEVEHYASRDRRG